MVVWIHAGTLVRCLNVVCVVAGQVLLALGPGLCTEQTCCRNCFLSMNGRLWMASDRAPDGHLTLWIPIARLSGVLAAYSLAFAASTACIVALIAGIRKSMQGRLLHPGLVNGLGCFGFVASFVGGSLGLAWAVGSALRLGPKDGPVTVRAWISGAVCLWAAAGLSLTDLALSFVQRRERSANAKAHSGFHDVHPFLQLPPPQPALSISDTQSEGALRGPSHPSLSSALSASSGFTPRRPRPPPPPPASADSTQGRHSGAGPASESGSGPTSQSGDRNTT